MTIAKVFTDVEGGLRTWLRTQTDLTTLVDNRIFFGIPRNDAGVATTSFPLITLQRVGGAPQSGEAPLDEALIQFDIWGSGQNKVQCWTVTQALIGILESFTAQEVTNDVYIYGINTTNVLFLPDVADGRARYSVTTLVTARAA
jgi:hypothetical protein